ncbi:MAG: transcription antitermination factor NusB, partial [Holosporaceae bacterium]|nr:transcription antitermination factor NusB [Holosporaceae bacterium]
MSYEKRKPGMGLRRAARFYAVQMAYKATIIGHPLKEVIYKSGDEIFISESISIVTIDVDFFQKLIKTTGENLADIDKIIEKNLSNKWRIDRLDNVMISVLRLGVAELLYLKNIPTNVVFDEYIEISKSFFDKSEVAFVNGLLN